MVAVGPDPLTDIWDSEIVPMLERTPDLRPITIFEEMIRRHPERDLGSARRTLERRVRLWKARFGPQQEVIFRQEHPARTGPSRRRAQARETAAAPRRSDWR